MAMYNSMGPKRVRCKCGTYIHSWYMNQTCIDCQKKKSQARIDRRAMWRKALANCPWMANVPALLAVDKKGESYVVQKAHKRGQATALRLCLGYQVYSAKGRSNAQMATYKAIANGALPRGQDRKTALQALAGPHGAVIARTLLIQKDQAWRFKHWPDKE